LKKLENEPKKAIALIKDYRLPRECVPTGLLNSPDVWEALLRDMKPEAMIRNLGKMTSIGLVKPLSEASRFIVETLNDETALKKSRLHPIKVLTALLTYQQGHGTKGSLSWSPDTTVASALDAAFYKTFMNVEPSNKKTLLALDVSGSMDGGFVGGVQGLSPRLASAAMALITAATEKQHAFVGFSTQLIPLAISPRQRLDDVVEYMRAFPFGRTDCTLPIAWAFQNKVEVETFVIYTDSETWAGNLHPAQALKQYRKATGINAKLIVVGMVANDFTIADPNDAGMMDVVGFDTAAPVVMADFARK
jgi:60 kDa SS-A/Ro ribonucleoprotein